MKGMSCLILVRWWEDGIKTQRKHKSTIKRIKYLKALQSTLALNGVFRIWQFHGFTVTRIGYSCSLELLCNALQCFARLACVNSAKKNQSLRSFHSGGKGRGKLGFEFFRSKTDIPETEWHTRNRNHSSVAPRKQTSTQTMHLKHHSETNGPRAKWQNPVRVRVDYSCPRFTRTLACLFRGQQTTLDFFAGANAKAKSHMCLTLLALLFRSCSDVELVVSEAIDSSSQTEQLRWALLSLHVFCIPERLQDQVCHILKFEHIPRNIEIDFPDVFRWISIKSKAIAAMHRSPSLTTTPGVEEPNYASMVWKRMINTMLPCCLRAVLSRGSGTCGSSSKVPAAPLMSSLETCSVNTKSQATLKLVIICNLLWSA